MACHERQLAYLHEPTRGRLDQAARDAARSPLFRAKIDAARRLAHGHRRRGYARTTGPLTDYDWQQLIDLLADNEARARANPGSRKYGRWQPRSPQGLSHVRRYLRQVRAIAHDHLLSETLAAHVHDCVRHAGYLVELPANLAQPPALTGTAASSVAAHITRTPWGSGTAANYARYHRARPHGEQAFTAQYTLAHQAALAKLQQGRQPPPPPDCPNGHGRLSRRTRLDSTPAWWCPTCRHEQPLYPPPTGPAPSPTDPETFIL